MAAKKKTSKKITKTAFILSLPRDLPATQAVEKAKAAGIKGLSETYIYKIRSRKKTAGGAEKGKTGPKPKGKGKVKTAPKKKGGRGSASDFVRSMPADTPAKKVVAAAAKRGLKISEGTVYQTRAYDRSKRRGSKSKPGPKTPKFQVFPGGGGAAEEQFKNLLALIGIERSKALVEEAASWGRVFGVVK